MMEKKVSFCKATETGAGGNWLLGQQIKNKDFGAHSSPIITAIVFGH